MTNSESIALVERSISDVEAELGKLASLKADAVTSQETVRKLETDLAELHANTGNLEPKVRSSRHVSGASLLALERADLAALESQVNAQADRVVQFHGRAFSLLQELHFAVQAARKAGIEEMLERTFDLSRACTPTQLLVASAYCLIEIEQLNNSLFQYRSRNERDLSLHDARELRTCSAPLIEWAKDLPDLSLKLTDPGVKPVVKPRPAAIGNQLGAMVAPDGGQLSGALAAF